MEVFAQNNTNGSCDLSIQNNPCIKQFHATPAMCERAKILNETLAKDPSNLTAQIEQGAANFFLMGCPK